MLGSVTMVGRVLWGWMRSRDGTRMGPAASICWREAFVICQCQWVTCLSREGCGAEQGKGYFVARSQHNLAPSVLSSENQIKFKTCCPELMFVALRSVFGGTVGVNCYFASSYGEPKEQLNLYSYLVCCLHCTPDIYVFVIYLTTFPGSKTVYPHQEKLEWDIESL